MSRAQPPLPPHVRGLLDHEREIPPLPATARARAIARARAALVAGAHRRATPAPAPRTRWAAAAAVVCILGVAVGAAAYQIRAHLAPAPSDRPAAAPVEKIATPTATPLSSAPPPPPAVMPPAPARVLGKPALSRADAARAELRLLRQARAAVAREDYADALRPIAEHARLFKDGRLSEEREALRVKALVGVGRTAEARRAAAAFRARFPRSVLLPAISQMPTSEP
jgi:hypothetical protein